MMATLAPILAPIRLALFFALTLRRRFRDAGHCSGAHDERSSVANNGHLSSMCFSAVSRTTHARDTFLFFAMPSRVSQTAGGSLIVARTCAVPFIFLPAPFFAFMPILHRSSP